MTTGSVILRTPRLILRDFKPSDWKAVHEYASQERVVRFMPWGPNSPAQTRAFLRRAAALARKNTRRSFETAVTLKGDGRLIGAAGIRLQDAAGRVADLGYCFNPRFWGRGYATEATKALIRFGFGRLKLHRIWATCDVQNRASARVLQRAGMRREGRLREDLKIRGKWRSSYLYAIVAKAGK